MEGARKELYSDKISAGSRTYFFDLKESTTGAKYLTINESRKGDAHSFEHSRVMVFEEHLSEFLIGLEKAVRFALNKEPTHSVDDIRREHPKAYTKWQPKEEDLLAKEYAKGRTISELAGQFQRQPGAIRSRLRKLGLS
jgi:hypothetical protein